MYHYKSEATQFLDKLMEDNPEMEAHGDVVRCTAPRLDGEELRGHARDSLSSGDQVGTAHTGGQQGLVRIAESGVGDSQRGLGTNLLSSLQPPPPGLR